MNCQKTHAQLAFVYCSLWLVGIAMQVIKTFITASDTVHYLCSLQSCPKLPGSMQLIMNPPTYPTEKKLTHTPARLLGFAHKAVSFDCQVVHSTAVFSSEICTALEVSVLYGFCSRSQPDGAQPDPKCNPSFRRVYNFKNLCFQGLVFFENPGLRRLEYQKSRM